MSRSATPSHMSARWNGRCHAGSRRAHMRNVVVSLVAAAAILAGATVTPASAQAYGGPYDDGPYSEDDGPYGDDRYGPPPPPPPPRGDYRYRGCSRDRTAGTIIGGILGGIIGN